MSDNPLDKLPEHNRVSIRAVLVHEGEDASAALAEAGFVNAIAIPVMLGDELDLSGGILGNGITPNLIAVLETGQEDESGKSPVAQTDTGQPEPGDVGPSEPVTTMLPPAFGMQPLAPVRPYRQTGRIAKPVAGVPPDLSSTPGSAGSLADIQLGSARSVTDDVHSPEPIPSVLTEPSGIQTAAPDGQPIDAGPNDNRPSVSPRALKPASMPEAAQGSRGAPSRVANVAAPPPQTTAPVPFVDDKGQGYLNVWGDPMLRPTGLDPHFFVEQGLKDKQAEEALLSSGAEGGDVAALAYKTAALAHFRPGGPWDAQRLGGSYHTDFVDYSTVAIGLYAAANGMSRAEILEVEDLVARLSHFHGKPEMDKIYTHLPVRNIHNTDLGYQLYQSGKIAATSKP